MSDAVFTLDIDGRPTLVFNASSAGEARGICALDEFRDDLTSMASQGHPVCGEASSLSVRTATAVEIARFRQGSATSAEDDGPIFVFLIPVDGTIVHVIADE